MKGKKYSGKVDAEPVKKPRRVMTEKGMAQWEKNLGHFAAIQRETGQIVFDDDVPGGDAVIIQCRAIVDKVKAIRKEYEKRRAAYDKTVKAREAKDKGHIDALTASGYTMEEISRVAGRAPVEDKGDG